VLAFITEIVVDMCILPLSDTELGGGLPYQWWLAVRALTIIPLTLVNVAIMYPIYKIIRRNFDYDYTKYLIEDLNKVNNNKST
jgi:hypothetical protein